MDRKAAGFTGVKQNALVPEICRLCRSLNLVVWPSSPHVKGIRRLMLIGLSLTTMPGTNAAAKELGLGAGLLKPACTMLTKHHLPGGRRAV